MNTGSAGRMRGILLATILGLALFGFLGRPAPASATIIGCRGDPVVTLSDGTKLQIAVVISADALDVEQVSYVVHGPVGVSLNKVQEVGKRTFPEHVDYVADGSSDGYTVQALVDTGALVVPTVLDVKMKSAHSLVAGNSGDLLEVSLTKLPAR